MITQKELLENLLYDKDTGIFTRKISLNTKVRASVRAVLQARAWTEAAHGIKEGA